MATKTAPRTCQTKDEHCIGCRDEACVKHGEAVRAGQHVHVPNHSMEETYRTPLTPGVPGRKFYAAYCGGGDGCGAVFFGERWYLPENRITTETVEAWVDVALPPLADFRQTHAERVRGLCAAYFREGMNAAINAMRGETPQ